MASQRTKSDDQLPRAAGIVAVERLQLALELSSVEQIEQGPHGGQVQIAKPSFTGEAVPTQVMRYEA